MQRCTQLLVSHPGQCLPQQSQEVSGTHERPGAESHLKDRVLSHWLLTDPFQLSSLFPLHWFVQLHIARNAQGTRRFCSAKESRSWWLSAPTGWHGQVERRGSNSKKQDIRAGLLIPTEIYGVIFCSFNSPSSLMKVRQTRRTAMIKNTRLDKEIKPSEPVKGFPLLCAMLGGAEQQRAITSRSRAD